MKSKKFVFMILFAVTLIMMPVLAHAQKLELRSAKIYMRENPPKFDKAEELLKTALEKDPENSEAHFFLGMVYYYQGNYNQFFAHWENVVYSDLGKTEKSQYMKQLEDMIRVRYNAATQSYEKKDFAGAVNKFHTSIRASEMLQKELVATGKKKEMQAAELLDKNKQAAYLYMGYAALAAEDYDNAVLALEKVLEKEPDKVEAWDGLINIYYRQDNHEKLIVACNKTIELSKAPELNTFLMLRNAYFETADTANVIETYEKAITAHPTESTLYRDLSILYAARRNYARAIVALEKGRASIPDDVDILNYLGTVYYNQGFTLDGRGKTTESKTAFSKAIAPLEKLLQMQPKNIDGNDTLSKVYYGLAKTEMDTAKKQELITKGDEYAEKKRELIMSGEGK